jgi:hypothetical protein
VVLRSNIPVWGQEGRKGPYASIASVTLVIARELKREIAKRDAAYAVEA